MSEVAGANDPEAPGREGAGLALAAAQNGVDDATMIGAISSLKEIFMRIIKDTSWILLTIGIAVAALSVGLLIEFGRADQVRSQALVEVCVLSLMSYFTPTLWLRRRYASDFGWALLIGPIVGTILVLLIVVHILNAISIWKRSDGETSIVDAL